MFTGLIEVVGQVEDVRDTDGFRRIRVFAPGEVGDLAPGSSIAIQGVCVTAVEVSDRRFSADLSRETLGRTTLGLLEPGAHVNLERALRADSRFGGHIVQGHVDGVGQILGFGRHPDDQDLTIGFDPDHQTRLVHKGSVAVDGISLTIARLERDRFSAAIIPFTLEHTSLRYSQLGDKVNLEFDVLAKYVERLVEPYLRNIGRRSGERSQGD
jgi:riboflavin synthase